MLTKTTHKRLLIIGSGGHGRVVADYAELLCHYREISFLDDSFGNNNTNGKWLVIGARNSWKEHISDSDFIVAFSSNIDRALMLNTLTSANVSIVNIIHPRAVISKNVTLGLGITICANAVVNVGTQLSDGCIINTAATIDHDCFIGQCVHISPGVHLAGGVRVGKNSWLGIGSSVIEGVNLAENIQVAAGAVVIKAEQSNALYMGVPAKVVRPLDINNK
jgi:UDP-N-acetylbacillosamine N-acetyltransferase